MPAYVQGIETPYAFLAGIATDVSQVAINFFVNRTPVYSRFAHVPSGALTFTIVGNNFRPNSTTVNENPFAQGDGTLTVADGSIFLAGDVIEIENEQLLVTAVSTNDLTVTRGYASTVDAAHANTTTVYLIGNSRTGGEVDQLGISRIPATVVQNLQTFQHPVQIGGSLASATNYALPPGVSSLLGLERINAMQETADDYERSCYYGKGVALAAATTRPAQVGLRSLLTTNNTTSPTNAGAYGPDDLIRDAIEPCFARGGQPDTLLVSTNFMTGLALWKIPVLRLDAGVTRFDVAIDAFEVAFLPGITVIPAPLLRPGTAISLSSGEVRNRMKRPMFDKPRGSRGDAEETDIIMEAAIEVFNESHHAWVSGITGFAA